jgi:ribose transport system ATP-binding protein
MPPLQPGERGLAVQLTDIRKSFAGVPVLDAVNLSIEAGSLHALLGGNGSGKSTTLKILAGVYQAEPGGNITVHGTSHAVQDYSAAAAKAAGLRFVHQDLGLVPDLSVAENFALEAGFPRRGRIGIGWRRLHLATQEALDRARVDVDAHTLVRELRPSERTLVAIARALRDAEDGRHITLVLDEPTASLPHHEVDLLLQAVSECRGRGQTIIYVSHRLAEVLAIADRISVLRDGTVAADIEASVASQDRIVSAMTGTDVTGSASAPARTPIRTGGEPLLRVRALAAGALRAADLDVASGEVVGIAGLVGSGRSSLLRALFGDLPAQAGTIALAGRPLHLTDPATAIRHGIALVPEARATEAAFLDRPLWENISAATLRHYWSGWRMNRRAERGDAIGQLSTFAIRAGSPDLPFATVSGGNQQKAILARWFQRDPRLLLLDEPTQGVDAVARADIHRFIRAHASRGNAAVVASSDGEELAELCDRVVVLHEGRTVAELSGAELTDTALTQLIQRDRTPAHDH